MITITNVLKLYFILIRTIDRFPTPCQLLFLENSVSEPIALYILLTSASARSARSRPIRLHKMNMQSPTPAKGLYFQIGKC